MAGIAAIGIERYDNIPRTVNESFAQRVTFCRAPIARQPGQLAGRGGPPRLCHLGRGRLPRLPHAATGAACAHVGQAHSSFFAGITTLTRACVGARTFADDITRGQREASAHSFQIRKL